MKKNLLIGILVIFLFSLVMFSTTSTKAESDYPEHCTTPDKEVVVGMELNLKFNVTEIKVDKGECFTIVIQNQDPHVAHDFVIDEVGGGSHSTIDANLSSAEIDHVDFDSETPTTDYGYGPNGINKFNVQAPNVDAEFEYYCDVEGHKDAGMVGTLIVGNGTPSASSPGFEFLPLIFGMIGVASIVLILRKTKY